MADKNKLYITITDKRDGDGQTPTQQPKGTDGEKESALGRYAEHQLFHLIKNQVTKTVNFSISQIGNLSGDYTAQRKVNEVKQAISGVMQVGQSTLGGAAVGGWVGAIIGFAVGTISLISNTVQDEISNRIENTKTNLEIAALRDRAGLNSVYDGSRGTEN